MRLGHLSDHEIQEYLDRTRLDKGFSKQMLSEKEHIDNCMYCQEAVREYEELYETIACCPEPELSPDFTQSVMLHLPVQSEADGILSHTLMPVFSSIVGLVALLLTIDIKPLLGRVLQAAFHQYLTLEAWLGSVSMPEFSWPSFSFVPRFLESAMAFLSTHTQTATLLLFIIVTLLLISTLDRLLLGRIYERL